MAAFAACLLQYLITFIAMVLLALAGVFLGKTLRVHKNAKLETTKKTLE